MARQKRKPYDQNNKYQKRIIFLTFVPTLIICIFISFLAVIFYRDLINVILYQSAANSMQFIYHWGYLTLFGLWIIFIIVLFWACIISNHIVGPFQRIIREMDEVLAKKEKKHIVVRENDELAQEILKRVNKLIDHYEPSK